MMKAPLSITQDLSQLIWDIRFEEIPRQSIEKAKLCILDTLGCALGASNDDTNHRIFQQLDCIELQSKLAGEKKHPSSAWTRNQPLNLLHATLFNGILSHTLELDDVHHRSKMHAGAVVVPVALTLGILLGSQGKDVLRAVVIGYEVALRLGEAIGVREHRKRGWHCTSTLGVFGAAAASSILLGLSPHEITSAFGLAGTHAAGLWTFHEDGTAHKRLNAGKAAHDGLLAAELAAAGLRGPSSVLEGEDGGLFQSMSSNARGDIITRGWDSTFKIDDVSFKIHAVCRSMHPALDAILELRAEHDLSLENVRRVRIDTYEIAKLQCDHVMWPQSSQEAKFNFRYAVSVALNDGVAFIEQFCKPRIQDPKLQARAPEVNVFVNAEFEGRYPEEWGCEVTITRTDGRAFTKQVRFAKGTPQNPLSESEVKEKYLSLAPIGLPEGQCHELRRLLDRFEQIADVSKLPL
jgi:2-methylcitrate dehydratase PrpD